ncbi:TetR/AcrR family transcriptional regulator [Streptomyces sp. PHES57]|uniref:TetR/AcrR family transcriptional regulator n=1 Tax=Streptomyces TaxID=1883 RepID=UPI0006B65E24|nr:TetR/AcrR family transcriptional regulator [Streptomyces sp. PHES57]KPC96116.1 TetR family transcriptional regulator [Streptomyces sp. NRRL F-6602]
MTGSGKRPGPPPRLSREAIVRAALASGDLESLSMRELAARLGVSHSALYRWVAGRDGVIDLVSEAVIDKIVPADPPTAENWRDWLARLAWAAHDEFLAVPGYATRVSRPHRHSRAFTTMQDAVVSAFTAAGAPPRMAWHSWYIFGTSLVTWLGAQEQRLMGDAPVRFDLFLDSLLRGLPAAEPPALGIRPPA